MLKEYAQFIPELKEEIISRFSDETPPPFLNFLTDSDITNIYAEWLSKNKPTDHSTQNGFIFEILSRRFMQSIESTPTSLQLLKEVFLFLTDGENQRQIWNDERCTPDDLSLSLTKHSIEITKVIECKMSTHTLKKSFHQKESTKSTVKSLVSVLSGDYDEVKSEKGKRFVTAAREKLRRIYPLPLKLSPNYKYVYVLPSDQHYSSQNPKDANLEVVNLPFSTLDIDRLRESTFTYLAKVDL